MCEDKSKNIINGLNPYPLTQYCFEEFITWICSNVKGSLEEYDLIDAIEKNEKDRLKKCEELLVLSRDILKLSNKKFCKAFGFSNDLLTEDPEKIHDILAEPLFVVDLNNSGFTQIQKLPQFIKSGSEKKHNSDFLATHDNSKFAIELKTIRMENKPKPEEGKLLGDSTKSYWWGDMLHNNAVMKMEDKKKRVIKQLSNTRQHYGCDKIMLALYTRRLGTSSLMTKDEYVEELKKLKSEYQDIDHFACKDYFGMVCFYPEISTNAPNTALHPTSYVGG